MAQCEQKRSIDDEKKVFENNLEYEKYVDLLKEYFRIKNDEVPKQKIFEEILTKHRKLVQEGILTH